MFRHPDHFREVLLTRADDCSKKHTALESLTRVLGDGLLTTDGDTWKRQRRMVQPAFTRRQMGGYAEMMVDETLAQSFRARLVSHHPVEPRPAITLAPKSPVAMVLESR